jgi:hypothetical protein
MRAFVVWRLMVQIAPLQRTKKQAAVTYT